VAAADAAIERLARVNLLCIDGRPKADEEMSGDGDEICEGIFFARASFYWKISRFFW
jgi:hypothetical protein